MGLPLVGTLFLEWTRSGNGSLVFGAQLGRLLAANHETGSALAVFAVATCGGVLVALAATTGPLAAACRITVALIVAALIGALTRRGLLPVGHWGPAPIVAATTVAVVLVLEVSQWRHVVHAR